MRTDERLFSLEQLVKRAATRDELRAQLEGKAATKRVDELKE